MTEWREEGGRRKGKRRKEKRREEGKERWGRKQKRAEVCVCQGCGVAKEVIPN